MRLILVGLSACLIAAPAMAQKFVSVTGESERTTVGAVAAEEAGLPQETAVEGEIEVIEGEQVADAQAAVTLPPPATINLGDPVDNFIPDAGECNSGSLWNQQTGRCETF